MSEHPEHDTLTGQPLPTSRQRKLTDLLQRTWIQLQEGESLSPNRRNEYNSQVMGSAIVDAFDILNSPRTV